jgi:probable rRNA maturation factor
MKLGSTIVLERTAGGLNSRALGMFLAKTLKVAGLRGSVSVLITGDTKIRDLNSKFRRKNSATDVLSFPAAAANGFVGDIAISVDIARKNARALGHSLDDEIRILILHGILHLAGYDHENDRGEMEQKETELRKKLALPTGLIERSSKADTSSVVGRRSSAESTKSGNSGQRGTTKDQRLSRT